VINARCVLFKCCIKTESNTTHIQVFQVAVSTLETSHHTNAFNWSYCKPGVTYICKSDIHSALGRPRQTCVSTHELCHHFYSYLILTLFYLYLKVLGNKAVSVPCSPPTQASHHSPGIEPGPPR